MKRDKRKEEGVIRELFRLTQVIGYGPDCMKEVFDEFVKNHASYEAGTGKITNPIHKKFRKLEEEMSDL